MNNTIKKQTDYDSQAIRTTHFPDNLHKGWRKVLAEEKDKEYFKKLIQFLRKEKENKNFIFPPQNKILRALQEVDYSDVRVVILGQDPYHGPHQAIGLCFAVPNDLLPKPPSLLNIFKEIESDMGCKWDKKQSELTGWTKQGVLLLNTVLTVRKGEPLSHRGQGWEIFTDKIIQKLSEREKPMVFLLWGSHAQAKAELISKHHVILRAPHPSPLSAHRGFLGCKHFSKTNGILKKWEEPTIDWTKICES